MVSTVNDILTHYGTKGMRWGVRKSSSSPAAGGGHKTSPDHENAKAGLTKVKRGGVKTLSNKELQEVITRMNLEQQYNRVAPQGKGRKVAQIGGRFVADVLIGVGKSQAIKLANDQATKVIGNLLKK